MADSITAAGCALMAALGLGPCASDEPAPQPAFYRSLASPGAQLDAAVAASMISGYRRNNSLDPVELDPQLMRLAAEQAKAMAARDKLDHNLGKDFKTRIKGSGFVSHPQRVKARRLNWGLSCA